MYLLGVKLGVQNAIPNNRFLLSSISFSFTPAALFILWGFSFTRTLTKHVNGSHFDRGRSTFTFIHFSAQFPHPTYPSPRTSFPFNVFCFYPSVISLHPDTQIRLL